MKDTKTKPRKYYRITPEQMAAFTAMEALHGNGSAAVRALQTGHSNVGDRALRIRKKLEVESTETYIDEALQQIGVEAVVRLGELVQSTDEKIAIKGVMYTIDHIRGQATKKSVTVSLKHNIQNVLD
jgi:hypothetical protein